MKTFATPSLLLLVIVSNVCGEDAVRPGRFVSEPPILICLGFEWDISGDDNRNASVDLSYCEPGKVEWNTALPLLRMGGERVSRIGHSMPMDYVDYAVPHKFAGSILDLNPDTTYEVRLTMKDPDGVRGDAVQTRKVRTRAEPRPACISAGLERRKTGASVHKLITEQDEVTGVLSGDAKCVRATQFSYMQDCTMPTA